MGTSEGPERWWTLAVAVLVVMPVVLFWPGLLHLRAYPGVSLWGPVASPVVAPDGACVMRVVPAGSVPQFWVTRPDEVPAGWRLVDNRWGSVYRTAGGDTVVTVVYVERVGGRWVADRSVASRPTMGWVVMVVRAMNEREEARK